MSTINHLQIAVPAQATVLVGLPVLLVNPVPLVTMVNLELPVNKVQMEFHWSLTVAHAAAASHVLVDHPDPLVLLAMLDLPDPMDNPALLDTVADPANLDLPVLLVMRVLPAVLEILAQKETPVHLELAELVSLDPKDLPVPWVAPANLGNPAASLNPELLDLQVPLGLPDNLETLELLALPDKLVILLEANI